VDSVDPGAVDRPPRLPATAWAVLGLLSFPGERSGYELKKWADHSLRFFYWSPAISNIYGELKRLLRLGYVVARELPEGSPRNRRVYRITDDGVDALARWIEDEPVEAPVLKDQALLRVWLGHVAGKDRVLALVASEEEQARRMIADVTHSLQRAQETMGPSYAGLVEQWCLRYATARLDAFAELRQTLASLSEPAIRTRREAFS
jgi:DNA-binding PadR family transcriptional regulator